jgi:hypothetical protein
MPAAAELAAAGSGSDAGRTDVLTARGGSTTMRRVGERDRIGHLLKVRPQHGNEILTLLSRVTNIARNGVPR